MNKYTKPGLLILMISLVVSVCTTLFMYNVYTSVNTKDLLESPLAGLRNMWLTAILSFVVSIFVIAGGLLILAGWKEFGERHRKFITYAVILFAVYFFIVVIFTNSFSSTIADWLTAGQASRGLSNAQYLQTSAITALLDSLIAGVIFGLIWVFSLYNLEDRRGRIILLAAFAITILVPIVTYLGSSTVINTWVSQGLLSNQTNSTTSYYNSDLLPVSAWTGLTGIILLLLYLLQYILLFIAMYIPYRRIANTLLSHPVLQ